MNYTKKNQIGFSNFLKGTDSLTESEDISSP